MTTLTIKINERSKKGKAFLEFAKTFFDEGKDVEIIESDSKKSKKEESLYNPEFVKMVLERDADIKSGKSKCITVDPDDVWGSLGLK
jgi:hypothetical protein